MIVSICKRDGGWWEVWLSLEGPDRRLVDGETPENPEEFLSRCMLRSRDIEAVLDLVAGMMKIWR